MLNHSNSQPANDLHLTKMQTLHADFLTAGSGAGRMIAALKAYACGLNVSVVEKGSWHGGRQRCEAAGLAWRTMINISKPASVAGFYFYCSFLA